MNDDPVRASQFTRMLFEIQQIKAESIANRLDMSEINSLMDLGGGSGILSMALLHRHAHLSATVVDIPNVCRVGLELAVQNSIEDRITFHAADFVQDRLPTGFDMVIECDVGIHSVELFSKIKESINLGGRYVIIDQFAPAKGMAPLSRISWALQGSLRDPAFSYPTAHDIVLKLNKAGYHSVTTLELPKIESAPSQFTADTYIIDSYI
jgi:cyclopropane fatty-acyl-phospholipid synthase-like methyltransferase